MGRIALMVIDPKTATSRDLYKLLVSTVLPRPIAWITTVDQAGVVNLAPFSYFQVVGSQPPMISVSVGQRKLDGQTTPKDTLRNINASGEFVVNIATRASVDAVNQSSAEYPPDVSEVEQLALTWAASDTVAPPRLTDSPVHFECVRERVIMLGDEPQVGLVIGEIVRFHIDDSVWDPDAGAVDPVKLDPLGRLGGGLFCGVGEFMYRKRP